MKNSEPGCLLWFSVAGKEGKASQKSPRGSVVKYQNKLPKESEDSASLEMLKSCLGMVLDT